ncbi:hypothetical protein BYT27DRAFT_7117576, partial [Phlegmacium glaucopus]
WETPRPLLLGAPNPFIGILLNGQQKYTTATKPQTLTPVSDESVELKSNDPTSILSINLHRTSLTPGLTKYIGSTELSIQDLEELQGVSKN